MRFMLGLFAVGLTASSVSFASSHREAPAISEDPAADITDVYAFKNPQDSSKVVLIMNVMPGYLPVAGPNWYRFSDQVQYQMNIDNNGDGVEDVVYRFEFKTANYTAQEGNVVAFFPDIKFDDKTGQYTGALSQSYKVTKLGMGKSRSIEKKSVIASNVPVAPPRIGPATTDGGLANADNEAAMYAAYHALASKAIKTTSSGYKFFAGPRNDPFFVDLGGTFDRVSVRIPGLSGTPKDSLKGLNVLSLVFEVPVAEILPHGGKHFGVWASTLRQRVAVLGALGPLFGGGWAQVARLGNPLVNEVVIRMKDKDRFNAVQPSLDAKLFASYVVNPQLATVLNLLYAGASPLTAPIGLKTINDKNRGDLVAAFVDGVPGVNRHPSAKTNAGDMLRLNLDLPDGWPASGRVLKDDVVKSALTFLAECRFLTDGALKGFDLLEKLKLTNHVHPIDSINCIVDDFVTEDDKTPGGNGQLAQFPYIDLPFSAYGKQN